MAVYLALDADFERSIATFDRLKERLAANRTNPEPSMIYLIGANRAAARFLGGDRSNARAEWATLTDIVDRIPMSSGRFSFEGMS